MGAFKLINQDGNKAGDHIVGRGDEQKIYRAGDVVESEEDLIALFPGKFEHAPPGSKDSFSEARRNRSPITGLPSKRTPRPMGPEESGNTRAEVKEVAEAIETGDHEVEQRADPSPPMQDKPRKGYEPVTKVAPITKTARRGDVRISEEEDEERPVKRGVGGAATSGSSTSNRERAEAENREARENTEPVKKKKKSSQGGEKKKVKVKVKSESE